MIDSFATSTGISMSSLHCKALFGQGRKLIALLLLLWRSDSHCTHIRCALRSSQFDFGRCGGGNSGSSREAANLHEFKRRIRKF